MKFQVGDTVYIKKVRPTRPDKYINAHKNGVHFKVHYIYNKVLHCRNAKTGVFYHIHENEAELVDDIMKYFL